MREIEGRYVGARIAESGKGDEGGTDIWALHARCTVSSHVGNLSQTIVIWTSYGPISKFGDLDYSFGS